MTIDRLPGVYYEEDMTYELTGVGSKIPIFIGITGNSSRAEEKDSDGNVIKQAHYVDGKHFQKFKNYSEVCTTLENGGIGTESSEVTTTTPSTTTTGEDGETTTTPSTSTTSTVDNLETNKLLKAIKEFYQEARLLTSGDVGVPYIYVIDIGTGDNLAVWEEALKTAKTLHDATVEVYVGAKIKTGTGANATRTSVLFGDTPLTAFLEEVYYGIGGQQGNILGHTTVDEDYGLKDCERNLDLRYAFTTVEGATDEDLIKITQTFQKSRIGLVEPFLFGKTIARICCTPNNTEPGYFTYRSVNADTFIPRNKHDMLALQNAGIIFNRDEHINGNVYPKINLCVSTSFANTTGRPADALFHARFNADDLLREVFEACYTQVKNNESATNIAYLQTRVNKIVNDRVTAEEMVKYDDKTRAGTKLYVEESESNPYDIIVKGQLQPVKCTIAIKVSATIKI